MRNRASHTWPLFLASVFFFLSVNEPASATLKPAGEQGINRCGESGNLDRTIAHCTEAIESGRLSRKRLALAFYRRGNAYNGKRNYELAIQDYEEAIRLNPKSANFFTNRGVALMGKREYDRAIESYTEAIRLAPRRADTFSNRGVAYARKRDYDRALADYNEALRLDPNHANALFNRGNAYRHKKDYAKAIQDYDASIRLSPSAKVFSNRGIVYSHKGEHALAIQSYNEALRLNPNHLNALYNRANAFTRKGEYARAIADFDRLLELRPKHAGAYTGRGMARFLQGQFSVAAADFAESLRHAPNNLYSVLLLYIAHARTGDDRREILAAAAREFDLDRWPGPIVAMYLDKVPEEIVVDSVVGADAGRRSQRSCEVFFYIGQRLLIQGQTTAAAPMFQQAVATNAAALFEHEAAEAELNRLRH